MNNENQVRSFFNALAHADRAALLRTLHTDLSWVVPKTAVPPYAGTHTGAEHIADMMLGSVDATFVAGSLRYDILLLMSDSTRAIAEVNLTAATTDGRTYDNFYVFIFEMRDGLIAEIREHVDTAYAIQFFGKS